MYSQIFPGDISDLFQFKMEMMKLTPEVGEKQKQNPLMLRRHSIVEHD